ARREDHEGGAQLRSPLNLPRCASFLGPVRPRAPRLTLPGEEETMRLTGPRRGNPAVRFMVEQTARRRMWSALGPSRGAAEDAAEREGTRERSGAEERWSRAFFDTIRASLLPRMAPVAETPEGRILYYGSAALCLWAVESPRATALAYEYTETPAQIRE